MARRNEFVEHVVDRLTPLGAASARAMFGGWGIYLDGRMVALVTRDQLYLRTDAATRAAFEAQGARPFKPFDDKPMVMPYHELPGTAIDDPDEFIGWMRLAIEAAARAVAPRRLSRRPPGAGGPPDPAAT